MFDRYNRRINYLRISVTDRCNLRCYYCMPEEGITLLQHQDILTFEEIEKIVRKAVELGIEKVRLTGGEPLVRKGIVQLVQMIADIPGIKDFGMTTNGMMLENFAHDLFNAGLHRLNISLDTTDPVKFREMTRGGDISNVFRGIEAAKKAGFKPIKLNCVIVNSSTEENALEVAEYAQINDLEVRYIHYMSLSEGRFSVVEGGSGGDCPKCSRLRLTADGKLKPCLFSNLEYDIRELGIDEAFKQAVSCKPKSGSVNSNNLFHNIGG
jgi:GTP 3',8-cyclase